MTGVIEMPERIGRFRLLSMLGRGAMGVVYKGHDEHIDRLVAIKLIRADLLDSEERENYFRRFRNEAQIAGRCVHANIVGLYDYSFHEGNPYLVMEYVNGCGLQQLSGRRGVQQPLDEVLPIALQVLDALQYAHERGIVHRDVKPANILLTPQSRLKITDFGISRLSSSELTMTPLLIGTPSYMSPEQCMGAELDGRSDLFSLGCVLYELLAGRRPFVGVNYTDTILGIINKPHVPLSEVRPDLPDGVSAVIDRALSKRPEDRHVDANAFARALDRYSAGTIRVPDLPKALTNAVADHQQVVAASDETVMAPGVFQPDGTQPVPVPSQLHPEHNPDDDTVLVSLGDINQPGKHAEHVEAPEEISAPSENTAKIDASRKEDPQSEDVPQDPIAGNKEVYREVQDSAVSDAEGIHPSELPASETPLAEGRTEPTVAPRPPPEPVSFEPSYAESSRIEPLHAESTVAEPASYEESRDTDEQSYHDVKQTRSDLVWSGPPELTESTRAVDLADRQAWVTQCLAQVIGPIAPKVVAKVWREDNPEMLVEDCARFIRRENEHLDFLNLIQTRRGAR